MRVKTAELKTRLSHYVRQVNASGEPIEVCVREQPVAYLCPLKPATQPATEPAAIQELRERLAAVGLELRSTPPPTVPLPVIDPTPAGDGRTNLSTVTALRAEKDW